MCLNFQVVNMVCLPRLVLLFTNSPVINVTASGIWGQTETPLHPYKPPQEVTDEYHIHATL